MALSVRFDRFTVSSTAALALVTLALLWLLRDVLVTAPSTVFPLILTVVVGGTLIVVFAAKRSQR